MFSKKVPKAFWGKTVLKPVLTEFECADVKNAVCQARFRPFDP